IDSAFYVVLMVADDPSEDDGLPLQDGLLEGNPGQGVIALRAEAFGPRGAHKTIEATISRPLAKLHTVTFDGGPAYDTNTDHVLNSSGGTTVSELAGARATAPFN